MSKGLDALKEIIKVDEEALTLANKEKNKKQDVMLHRHWLNERKNIIENELKDFEYLNTIFNKIKTKYGIDDIDYLEHICKNYEKEHRTLEIVRRSIVATPDFPVLETPIGKFVKVTLAIKEEEFDSFQKDLQ